MALNQGIEIQPALPSIGDAENLRRRQSAFDALLPMVPALAGNKIPNVGILGPGTYKGGVLTGTVELTGIGSPIVTGLCTFSGATTVRNVTFAGGIRVTANATVQLVGCIALLPITVDDGGKIVFTGGRFDGSSALLNSGDVTNSMSVGNVKTSTTKHTNTTIVAEV